MQSDADTKTLRETVFALTGKIVSLEPGPLARLRRMDTSGPGEGDFWKLAVAHGLSPPKQWLLPVRLMALLTPKGSPGTPKRLHDRKTPLGKALAESGYPESRIMRFLALPFDQRSEPLERMVRWLAAKGHAGIDCSDICNVLFVREPWPLRRLAETYYRALDSAAAANAKSKENNP